MQAAGAIDDDASSIRVASGYQVTLHRNSTYGGGSVTLTGDRDCLTGIAFNDAVSSLVVGAACPATAITPYVRVDGAPWQQVPAVTISSRATVAFGPQPTSGGAWSWDGCGTSGTSRQQTVRPTASCTATVSYTNPCGTTSSQTFSVTVSSSD